MMRKKEKMMKMKRREANKRAEITVHEPIPYFSLRLSIREAHLTNPDIFISAEEEGTT